MLNNTTGAGNVAIGQNAFSANTTGNFNAVVGENSFNNSIGSYNATLGYGSGTSFTSSNRNTLIGYNACSTSTIGDNNSVLGAQTDNGNFSGCVILGREATATASNQFVVGSASTNAGAVDTNAFTQDSRWKVKINGVDYYIALETV